MGERRADYSLPVPAAVPRVSVVMPTYQGERFVAEAVESVRAQTMPEWELLVVDDGSTDSTRAVVRGIADPRIVRLDGPHRGVGATRNAGVAAARAPVLAFLDQDDAFLPDHLARSL